MLAKANSRSTVHRPAYLDYVGVKTFDADGEVTGERRFLGLFSSAAYTESVWHVPLLREKAKDVAAGRLGLDPHSHTGKELIDILETYPRDELFQTPVDELAPMASRVHGDPRAPPAPDLRPARRLRPLRRVPGLPAPRPLHHRRSASGCRASSRTSFGGESVEYTVRVSESTTARVHFVVHPPRGQAIPDVDVAELERRLADATRSWRDDFTAAVIAEFGEDVGSRLARTYEASFPEAYKEDFSAATGAARPRPPRGARRDRHRAVALLAARRGRAARPGSRCSGTGSAISPVQVLPVLSSMGVEVVDERPYQLDQSASAVVHLRLRPALRAGDARPDAASLFQDAFRAVWDGLPRSTASTRWCSAPG